MTDGDMEHELLEELAADFLERRRQGESPSIDEYASVHPELAREIRELFPTIAAVERLKALRELSTDGRASLGPIRLEQLGDFRILREVGRGGMGIVYEAQQESLGRRVALKVLPRQALLEGRHLARFKREAQIASRLHHTNIVQVYGVGEQEGFHYYVMQYVRGVGMDRVIAHLSQLEEDRPKETQWPEDRYAPPQPETAAMAELLDPVCERLLGPSSPARPGKPSQHAAYYRNVAAVAEQAAKAMAYAHDQGTLHRDIKPSNLLLDDQGVVWITDFGLARAIDAPEVTRHGDLTGTLRYLAPERLRGQVDTRSDIYSLGLTLSELLTLRPAYDEADRSALIQRVTHEAPEPPRRCRPEIPRDLETIVLKAASREPRHRYASAGELAEDLRRFQEDRPILARRVGYAERLWRWCRRNRAVAALSAASLLLLVAVAAVAIIGYVLTKHALAEEAQQRQRAEAVAGLARDALDRVFDRLGPPRALESTLTLGGTEGTRVEIPGQPVLSKGTASLLEEMLPFYDRLAEQAGSEIAPRSRAADATRRVGDIRHRLGQYDRAEAAYLRAIGLYKDLAGEAEGKACLPRMAETWNELSKTYRLQRRLEEARRANQQALAILTAIPSDVVAQPAVRFELARTYYFLGMRLPPDPGLMPPGPVSHGGGRGDGPGPGPGADHGPGHGPDPGEGFGTDKPQHPLPFPISLFSPGPMERGERPEGPPFARQPVHLDTAVTILKDLVQRQPANPEYRHLLALCLRERFSSPSMGRPTSQSETDEATRILEQLVRDFPQVPDYLFDLCQTYTRGEGPGRGPPQDRAGGRAGEMEERLGKALAISQQLVAQHANVPEYRVSLAQIHHQLGEVRRRAMREEEAEQSDRKAVEVQAALVAEFPEVLLYKVWLAAYRNSLAEVLLGRGNVEEARALAEQTVAQAGLMLKDNPATWYLHGLLMDSNRTLAAALRRAGETDLADQAEQAAEQHGKELRAHLASTRPSL